MKVKVYDIVFLQREDEIQHMKQDLHTDEPDMNEIIEYLMEWDTVGGDLDSYDSNIYDYDDLNTEFLGYCIVKKRGKWEYCKASELPSEGYLYSKKDSLGYYGLSYFKVLSDVKVNPKKKKRTLRNKRTYKTIEVVEHIVGDDYNEYYVSDLTDDKNKTYCLILLYDPDGEIPPHYGKLNLSILERNIESRTKDLYNVAPADGWEWVDDVKKNPKKKKGKQFFNSFQEVLAFSAKTKKSNEYDCDVLFEVEIEGATIEVIAHTAHISPREFSLYSDIGYFVFVVDMYGDNPIPELFDWELETKIKGNPSEREVSFIDLKGNLTEDDVDQLVALLGHRCRLDTCKRLRSILTYDSSKVPNYGIMNRLIKENGKWSYITGQSRPEEIKIVRDIILKETKSVKKNPSSQFPIDINSENYFEVYEAIHTALTLWHGGQDSEEYRLLSRSEFSPGHSWSESDVEENNEYYSEIEELIKNGELETIEAMMAYIEDQMDNDWEEE
jgi:hypothetical protein